MEQNVPGSDGLCELGVGVAWQVRCGLKITRKDGILTRKELDRVSNLVHCE